MWPYDLAAESVMGGQTHMAWQLQWNRHPAVRTGEQLSLGERAADKMRNGMGSWPFVFTFFGFMITWAVVNSVLHFGGSSGFDPYPYILLNLFLSMLAGVQAAALLIVVSRLHRFRDRSSHREKHGRH